MNDLIRSLIFLGSIAAGAVGGFLSAGSEEPHNLRDHAAAKVVKPEPKAPTFKVRAGRVTASAVPQERRLARVLADLESQASTVGSGHVRTLLEECWNSPGGFYAMPALIDLLAQRDPRGCLEALLAMDTQNRCNSLCWTALFARWITAEPESALEALLELPDFYVRSEAGQAALQLLGKTSPEKQVELLSAHGAAIHAAGIRNISFPGPEPRRPRWNTDMGGHQDPRHSPAMEKLGWGSPEARRLAESRPATLTPADFRLAMGKRDEKGENLAWLGAQQQHAAARMALLRMPEEVLSHPELFGPELRTAAIRRLAVQRAAEYDARQPLAEWALTLTPDERQIAAEALHMDTTLTPEKQAAALKLMEAQ